MRTQVVGECRTLTVPAFLRLCFEQSVDDKLNEERERSRQFYMERFGANYDAMIEQNKPARRVRSRKNKGSQRVLCLVSTDAQDGVRTLIEVTTDANEWLNKLNEKNDKWEPCLYVTIPPHITDVQLKEIQMTWRKSVRGVPGRTKRGIELARDNKCSYFVAKRLLDPKKYPDVVREHEATPWRKN